MTLGRIRSSISYAPELTFGALDADGLPDVSGLSYTGIEVSREAVTYDGQDEPVIDRPVASAYPSEHVPEPLTVWSGGAPVERRTGEITLRMPGLRCPGAGQAMTTVFLARALSTVMRSSSPVTGDSDTVAAGVPTLNTFPATVAGKFQVGHMIAATINNRIEYAWVTDVTAGVVTYSPAFSAALSVGDTVRMVKTYYPTLGALSTLTSLSLRQDLHDRRWQAVGCRLKRLTLEMNDDGNGDRRIVPTAVTLSAPWIQSDDGSASPLVLPAQAGPYAVAVQAYDVYSSLAAVGTPADASRSTMRSRRWTVELSWDLRPLSTSDSGLTIADYECGGFTARVTQACQPISGLDIARRAREQYHLLLGAGPTSAGADGRGMGFAFGIKAAFLSGYAKPAIDDAEVLHELAWAPGPWERESGGPWSPSSPIDAPWTLGWVV